MRENGHPRAGAGARKFARDQRGDVRTWLEVGCANRRVRQGAVQMNLRTPLNQRLDLALPLFGTNAV